MQGQSWTKSRGTISFTETAVLRYGSFWTQMDHCKRTLRMCPPREMEKRAAKLFERFVKRISGVSISDFNVI
jgi:hypothetical protein